MIKSITFRVKSPYFSRMRKFNIGHWAAQPNLPMKTCPCPWLISNYPSIIIRTSWHGSTPKPWSLNPNQKGLPLPCKNPKMPPKATQKKPKKGEGVREFTIFARLHFFRWSCWKSMKPIIPMWPSWSMTNHPAGNPRVVSYVGLLHKIPKATKIVKWILNQIGTYSVNITWLIDLHFGRNSDRNYWRFLLSSAVPIEKVDKSQTSIFLRVASKFFEK